MPHLQIVTWGLGLQHIFPKLPFSLFSLPLNSYNQLLSRYLNLYVHRLLKIYIHYLNTLTQPFPQPPKQFSLFYFSFQDMVLPHLVRLSNLKLKSHLTLFSTFSQLSNINNMASYYFLISILTTSHLALSSLHASLYHSLLTSLSLSTPLFLSTQRSQSNHSPT